MAEVGLSLSKFLDESRLVASKEQRKDFSESNQHNIQLICRSSAQCDKLSVIFLMTEFWRYILHKNDRRRMY